MSWHFGSGGVYRQPVVVQAPAPDISTSCPLPVVIIESIGTGRDYETPAAWEAATDNDLVAANEIRIGEVYDDVTSYSDVELTGATTDSCHYRILRAATGHEYDPTTGNGVFFSSSRGTPGYAISIGEDFSRVEGVGGEHTGSATNTAAFRTTADNTVFRNCVGFVPDNNLVDQGACFGAISPSSGSVFINCIAIGTGAVATGAFRGFFWSAGVAVGFFGCVAYNIAKTGSTSHGFGSAGVANATVQNCAAFDSGNDDFTSSGSYASFLTSAASDTTGSSGALDSLIATDEFLDPSANNFRLHSGSALEDAGTDLSGSDIAFRSDIEGTTRSIPYEIGAYDGAFVAATGTSRGSARALSTGTRTAVSTGTSRGQARAISTGTRIAIGTGTSRGQARAVATGTIIRIGTAISRGSARATGTPHRVRSSTTTSRGQSRALGASLRTRTATGVSRGQARALGVAVELEIATGVSRGSSRALATPHRVRSNTGVSRGSARASATGTRIAIGTSVSRGSARALATPHRVRSNTGTSRGQARAAAAGTILGQVTGTGVSRGSARVLATPHRVRSNTGVSRGQARALATPHRIRSNTGVSRGSARAIAVSVMNEIATGVSRGQARALSVGTRNAIGTATSRGSARAVATGMVIAQGNTSISRGSARVIGDGTRTRSNTGISRGTARATAVGGRIRSGTGISRGISRATGPSDSVAGTGFSRGVARAIAMGSVVKACPDLGGSTELDDRLLPRTLEILQKLGRTVTLTEPATAVYDPATGLTTFNSPTVRTITASPPLAFERKYIDGDVVQRGDIELIVAAYNSTVTPALKHQVQFDGTEWQVVQVRPIFSGNDVAAWILQLRGGGVPDTRLTTEVTALDARLPSRVETLIQKFGKQARFLVLASRTYDPDTSLTTERGMCDFCADMVLDEHDLMMAPSATDERRVTKAYIKAKDLGFAPYPSMEVTFDSTSWDTTWVEPVYTGGLVALWILTLER